jgi:hypothetical protein
LLRLNGLSNLMFYAAAIYASQRLLEQWLKNLSPSFLDFETFDDRLVEFYGARAGIRTIKTRFSIAALT